MKPETIKFPQKFAFHGSVSNNPPEGATMTNFFSRLANGEELNREEKSNVFHALQSQSYKGFYRLAGWEFNFRQFMTRYLVKYNHDNSWTEIWAFDKTCIRSSFYTKSNICEIVQA